MASSDLETKAKEAFIDDHFEQAVDLYTQAIEVNPNKADLFVDRAQANIKLHNFKEAVADANKAIELDPGMAKAYLRKATACMKLEEYKAAKSTLETGVSLTPENSRFIKLMKECNEHIADEKEEPSEQLVDNTPNDMLSAMSLSSHATAAKPKYRHEYYQKPDEVVVTIFAKRVQADNIVVNFGEQILSVKIEVPGEEESYHLQTRLFGKIIPAKCRYEVMTTKIEIRLPKAETIHWTSLEYIRNVAAVQPANVSSGDHKPSYPSSKPNKKDWDKLEAEVKKEEKDEKLDGDAALKKFFSDIFQNSDEDMRRAMSKSFVESNGTVLSTNWKEVGSKKVEGSPPEGMELKKWEY